MIDFVIILCSYWPSDNFEFGIPFVKLKGAGWRLANGKKHQM